MQYLLAALISLAVAVGALFVPHEQTLTPQMQQEMQKYLEANQSPTFGTTQPFAGQTYNLAGSGISGSATTITLTSLTIKQTGQPVLTADLVGTGGTYYVTLEPGNNSRQEIVGCTGVSQGGTSASLTGCTRGLSPIYPYTASSTLQFSHSGGSQVIFSDPPQLFAQYYALANAATSSNTLVFGSTTQPRYDGNPTFTNGNSLINKAYADALSITGAPTSTFSGQGVSWLASRTQLAAGTASSTTGSPLVIPAIFASSTPITGFANNIVPITDANGFLSSLFISTTSAYTWTGAHTFVAATSTSFGIGGYFNWNTLGYTIGGTRAASSTVLTENGAGALSWVVPRVTSVSVGVPTTAAGTTAGTASTTLKSITIPANTLHANSGLRLHAQTTGANCFFDLQLGSGSASTSMFASEDNANGYAQYESNIFASTTNDIYSFSVETVAQSNGLPKTNLAPYSEMRLHMPYSITAALYLAIIGRCTSGNAQLVGWHLEQLNN